MFSRDELKQLQTETSYPSVSILMHTHRTFPENQQDSIRLKNLVSSAKKRLGEEFKKREIEPLLNNLDEAVEQINFNCAEDGLALYVNSNGARKFLFPFNVEEKVLIDNTFAIKDVVFMINRTRPYWLVMINEKDTKLYHCVREVFKEINDFGFPVSNELRKNQEEEMDMNEKVKMHPEKMKIYLRQADTNLKRINKSANEIVLTGVERYTSFFKEISTQQEQIAGTIKGSYEKANQNLVKQAWEIIRDLRRAKRYELFENAAELIKRKQFDFGMNSVWEAAVSGRIKTLLIEINYKYPATISKSRTELVPSELKSTGDELEDAVDELIDMVINKGGNIVFYKDGELEKYNRVAAILRY